MRSRLEQRASARRAALHRSLDEARSDFERIAEHIWRVHSPTRIKWGSLVDGRHFSERSDIDIALEGIASAEVFFAILRDVEALTRFPVHVVQLETIHPAYAESIRRRGRVVREG